MTVTGGKQVARRLSALATQLRPRIARALEAGAQDMLVDMQRLTPRGPGGTDGRARDALTVDADDRELRVRVGLPSRALVSDYFWFRFLDQGTAGGSVRYRNPGSAKVHTMTVPPRPALRILDTAYDLNRDRIEARLRAVVVDALRSK